MRIAPILFALSATSGLASEVPVVTALSWNVESTDADPALIAKQLSALDRCDFFCLQEVAPRDAARYVKAIRKSHGESYRMVVSQTGGNDRLVTVYDSDRFLLNEVRELFRMRNYEHNDWQLRAPLILSVRLRRTFYDMNIMNVHLPSADDHKNVRLAVSLREWAKDASQPTLALGTFNFEFDLSTDRGNNGFHQFTTGNYWEWARPNGDAGSHRKNADGVNEDNQPNLVDDFAFTSGYKLYDIQSSVIVRGGDLPDEAKNSDHNPIKVRLKSPGVWRDIQRLDELDRGFQVYNGRVIYATTWGPPSARADIFRPVPLDPLTYRAISGVDPGARHYCKDSRNVYLAYQTGTIRLQGCDASSFRLITPDGLYACDDFTVFYSGLPLKGSDPGSFEVLEEPYAKDARQAYAAHHILEEADPASFTVLERGGCEAPLITSGGGVIPRDRASKGTTSIWGWATDTQTFYNGSTRYSSIDAETFEPLGMFWSKDKNRVYYQDKTLEEDPLIRIVKEADAKSFRKTSEISGTDRSGRVFERGRLVESKNL